MHTSNNKESYILLIIQKNRFEQIVSKSYKKKQESKKTRKKTHALDLETDQEKKKVFFLFFSWSKE